MAFLHRLRLLVLRPIRRAPIPFVLSIVTIGLGVAMWVAVSRVGLAAGDAAERALISLVGKVDLTVDAPALGPTERLAIEQTPGVRAVIPRMVAWTTLESSHGGAPVRVVGVSWFLEGLAQTFRVRLARGDLDSLGSEPDVAVISAGLARVAGLDLGSPLRVATPSGSLAVTVRGIIDPAGLMAQLGDALILVSLSTAQQHWGGGSVCNHFAVLAEPEADLGAVADGITAALGGMARVEPVAERRGRTARSVRAFRVTWQLYAALAWAAGVLMVAGSCAHRVARRAEVLLLLRRLGAARSTLAATVIIEATFAGVLGGVLGAILGAQFAEYLAPDVIAAIDWFLPEPVAIVALSVGDGVPWRDGIAAGVVAALLGAVWPAWRTARLRGISSAVPVRFATRVPAWFGFGVVALGWVVFAAATHFGRDHAATRFGNGLAAVLAANAIAVPAVVAASWLALRAGPRRGLLVVTWQSVARAPMRVVGVARITAVALAAITALSGVRHAFAGALDDHLTAELHTDLVIGFPELPGRAVPRLIGASAVELAAGVPGVVSIATERVLQIHHGDREVDLVVREPADGFAVTTTFAAEFGLVVGDELALATPNGELRRRVDALIDVPRRRPAVFVSRADAVTRWPVADADRIDVDVAPGESVDTVALRLRDRLAPLGAWPVLRVDVFRADLRDALSRSFALIDSLRWIMLALAALGIGAMIGQGVLDRAASLRVLRAIGADRVRLAWLTVGEAAWVGAVAGLAGAMCGMVIGWAWTTWTLTDVLGWSVPWRPQWSAPLVGVALGGGVAAATALMITARPPAGRH